MEKIQPGILIVDDDASVVQYYSKVLQKSEFRVEGASNLTEMRAKLESHSFDAVLLDLNLGDEQGLDGIDMILSESPSVLVFVLTAHGTVECAVEAMRRGASGFLQKGDDPAKMVETLKSRVGVQASRQITDLTELGLIGTSQALADVFATISRLKDSDSTVLVLGESGTGKEVVARAVHRTSRRVKGRFDAINCGAIPENLLESELFGHKRGAFTDAKADRKGIFELCSNGTLLLDEIGDMPLVLQTKLLRVIQEREITPVGSSTSVKINTRVIAATHRNVMSEVKEGRFREDLYYRLAVIVIRIPALRERAEDIPSLVDHFLAIYNERCRRNVKRPSPTDMARLQAYPWPGNIRELQNAIERAVVLAPGDDLKMEDVFSPVNDFAVVERKLKNGATHLLEDEVFDRPLTEAKQTFERRYLEHLLEKTRGNVGSAAELSGRYRADVYRLLTRYGISHADFANR